MIDDRDCLEFQDQLAELISSGGDVYNHPHLKNCELCSLLLIDLEVIAENARKRETDNYG